MTGALSVEIVEVCLRDGLQNESVVVPTVQKLALAHAFIAAGLRRIEAVSFVHPDRVPSMADAEAVMAGLPRIDGVSYAALVLNERGLDRAIVAGVDEVNLVVCASDTFNRRNQGLSRDETMAGVIRMVSRAREAGKFTTVTIATAFGCPFEGKVDGDVVIDLAREALAAGAHELALADTIGVGVPSQVRELGRRVRDLIQDEARLRFHFHNTRNTGYANAVAAIAAGAHALDSSTGGLGGCPFAPRATGNIATEDLMYLLDGMGVAHAGRLDELLARTRDLDQLVGHPTESLVARAGNFHQMAS